MDRRGHIQAVVVGDARSVFLPDLSVRRGRDRLSGLRLVHTHLAHEPLTDDDLTDLLLLRLDMVSAVEVMEDGLPGKVFSAHLLPRGEGDAAWEVLAPVGVHDLPTDFPRVIEALEEEFARVRRPRRAGDTRDRAILLHVSTQAQAVAEDSLSELRDLARSAGIVVVEEFLQRRPIDPRHVMGRGKLKQVLIKALQRGAEMLIFDTNLSASQVEYLANYTDLKILDRAQVILDIFAQHAETREGKLQVELAQLRYLLPRLSAKHTAMSRLTGGIGGRGPGETKLELDRRRVGDRMAMLEREVAKLGDRRRLRRRMRTKKGLPIVSLVGYTNAGKSTLLNHLTESHALAEDALFATLNPVSRRLRFPQEREIIITDTVGFIRNLPSELKSAFRTTFEELFDSDLLLHVLDASRSDVEEQRDAVRAVLEELELDSKPELVALNKSDLSDPQVLQGLAANYHGIPVCALDRSTFGPLLEAIERALWSAAPEGMIEEEGGHLLDTAAGSG